MGSRDADEYAQFVHAVQHRLRRTAYLMTGDWAVAADLTQEALIKLYMAWPRIERGGGLATYARRTVVSTVLDHQRSRARRPESPLTDADLHVVQDETDLVEERERLMSALREIPPRQRATVVLRYFEELSVAETAAAMQCSEGNVKSQTSAALTALRARLGDLQLPGAGIGGTG